MSDIHDYVIRKGRESLRVNRGMSFQMTTIALDRIENAVQELFDIDKDKAIRAGLRSMGNTLVSGGKKRLKSRLIDSKGAKGFLYSSFVVRVKLRRTGVLAGFNKWGHHSHMVDRGTMHRLTTGKKSVRAGVSRGIMPANSFWTDTATEDWKQATDKLFEGIERAKNRIIERNAY